MLFQLEETSFPLERILSTSVSAICIIEIKLDFNGVDKVRKKFIENLFFFLFAFNNSTLEKSISSKESQSYLEKRLVEIVRHKLWVFKQILVFTLSIKNNSLETI